MVKLHSEKDSYFFFSHSYDLYYHLGLKGGILEPMPFLIYPFHPLF